MKSALQNHDEIQIVHIRTGRTTDDQASYPSEEMVGIVVLQRVQRINSKQGSPAEGSPVGDGAGSLGWSIGAVCPEAQDADILESGYFKGGSQGEFLSPPAHSAARDR